MLLNGEMRTMEVLEAMGKLVVKPHKRLIKEGLIPQSFHRQSGD